MRTIFDLPVLVRHFSFVTAFCATAAFTGCATAPPAISSGNYIAGSTAVQQKLARDTITQLLALFPPASTRFDIVQPTPDSFGIALVTGLREKGYAVMELSAVSTVPLPSSSEDPLSQSKPASAGLALRYLIDNFGNDNLYRLSLVIGSGNLNRAYFADNDGVQAAGAWVHKE